MKHFITYLFIFTSLLSYSQINTQGVLSNEQALTIAKQDGYQTLNIPILSRYKGLTSDQAKILEKLKLNSIIEYAVVDPVNQIVDTKITYVGNDFVAAQTKQGDVLRTYLAIALVEVDKVNEVRQHQVKNNAQTVDYQFRILNISSVGKALGWLKEGNTITHTVDYINTSNGWKKDMDDRNDASITSYRSSKYGPTGLSNYKNKLQDIEFVKNLNTHIIGKWNRYTKKEKKTEYYIFNEDGTFENYTAKKDETITGKYKFGNNYGDKIYISLIPREGKNKSKSLKRSPSGMYINDINFIREGTTTTTTSSTVDDALLDDKKQQILEKKKELYSKNLNGFWKSSNGKLTLDIKKDKTLNFKEKNNEYPNASYDITILNEKLYLIIFDSDLAEVFNQELKVVRADQMILGGKTYTKF